MAGLIGVKIRCPKCGAYYPDTMNACPKCGNVTPVALRNIDSPPPKWESSDLGPERSNGVAWILAPLVGVGVLVALLMTGGEDAPRLTPVDSPAINPAQRSIESQFSPISGAHRELERVIKAAMNDPDSYEHVDTGYVKDGDSIRVQTVYRGRNGFGGVVTERVTARISLDGQVLEILEQN